MRGLPPLRRLGLGRLAAAALAGGGPERGRGVVPVVPRGLHCLAQPPPEPRRGATAGLAGGVGRGEPRGLLDDKHLLVAARVGQWRDDTSRLQFSLAVHDLVGLLHTPVHVGELFVHQLLRLFDLPLDGRQTGHRVLLPLCDLLFVGIPSLRDFQADVHQRLLDAGLLHALSCAGPRGCGRPRGGAGARATSCSGQSGPRGRQGKGLRVLRAPGLERRRGGLRGRHRPVVEVLEGAERSDNARHVLLLLGSHGVALQGQLPQGDQLLQGLQLLRALQLVAREVQDLQGLPTMRDTRRHVHDAV
mmetsp:Transcript_160503/g.490631  ORF Transcript_160503/g.490631 Transcript_160503/m.490631 type:complete len:303 (-) Transcript_160503:845-1753(-)